MRMFSGIFCNDRRIHGALLSEIQTLHACYHQLGIFVRLSDEMSPKKGPPNLLTWQIANRATGGSVLAIVTHLGLHQVRIHILARRGV